MNVVVVGSSAAALSALESFRARDRDSSVTVVSAEAGAPYSRVLLPYYLRGRLAREGLFIRRRGYWAEMGARTVLGVAAERVDAAARQLELADGRRLGFDRLLLATGSRPTRPRIPGLEGPGIHHLWTLAEAERLDHAFRPGARLLVVGAGFVALQAAWAADRRGLHVTVLELEERILPRVLDDAGAELLRRRILARGVEVHTCCCTESVEQGAGGELCVCAAGVGELAADVVVVAAGVRPNDELLRDYCTPGVPGIPVTAGMETALAGVFAAGDVACGPVAGGGPPQIHALWPTAVEQGRVAGANLAGAGEAYEGSLSMNVTGMFGATVASLGRFEETDADAVVLRDDRPDIDYLKLVFHDGVPVGAVCVGGPQCAALLGRLRPYVRQRRPLDDVDAFIDGRHAALMPTGARRVPPRARPGGAPEKEAQCA